jgi:hypothetical protein
MDRRNSEANSSVPADASAATAKVSPAGLSRKQRVPVVANHEVVRLLGTTRARNVFGIGWTLLLDAIVAVCVVRRPRCSVGFDGTSIARLSAAGVGVRLRD